MATRTKKTTYNRRGYWPTGWSVERAENGDGFDVVDKSTDVHGTHEIIAHNFETELDAIIWADANYQEYL